MELQAAGIRSQERNQRSRMPKLIDPDCQISLHARMRMADVSPPTTRRVMGL